MPIKLATHLYRNRHGTFYFRFVIPKDLRNHVQKREFRFSLNTEQRHQAIIATIPLIAELPHLISFLRRMADNGDTIPNGYFQQWLAEKRKSIDLQARCEQLNSELIEANRKLANSTPRNRAERVVRNAYTAGQLKGSRELADKVAFPFPPEKTVLFSELKAAYLKGLTYRPAGARRPPPTPKTLDNYDKAIGTFIEVMGNVRIGEIDRQLVGKYFSTLKRLPANRNKIARYRDKTIPELLAMNEPGQDENTCSQKVERIATMFKWALEEKRKWGIDANPFSGFGQADSEETTRRPFTRDELLALLSHPDFERRQFHSSYMFWLIPLAIYTGARLGELCQLDLKDFVVIDNVQCIDINDINAPEVTEGDGTREKRVKTKNAKRLVPIHPELIRIGLLRYVTTLRDAGGVHLFPELSRTKRDGPSHAASNWFGGFRKKVGITVKQEAVFHSFRHLFITTILDSGIPPHMVAPIVGHEAELITGKVYWDKKDATKRLPTVEAFMLAEDVRERFPTIEEVTFTAPPRSRTRSAVGQQA